MAYNTTGHTIVIGDAASAVQPLVGANRQVELAGAQTITGVKTINIAALKLLGGLVNQVLKTDGAGNLAFIDNIEPISATDAEMAAGTLDTVFGTPKNIRSLVGASVTTLTTLAKTIVPAINEIKAGLDLLGAGQVFVGSFNATDGTITWTSTSGGAGDALPTPGPANAGWQLICEVAGSVPPGAAPAGAYAITDWLLSDGSVWTHLAFGGVSTGNASTVPVSPAVAGGADVQAALQGLDANKINRAGDTMAGTLVLAANPVAPLEAATMGYVDTKNSDQDAVTADKISRAGDTMTGALILPSAAPAVPEEAANKAYVDTKAAVAYVDTADTLRILKAGDSMAGPLMLPAAMPTLAAEAAHKAYVDQKIATTGVLVTGPKLTGNGLLGSEITFTGITSESTVFGGNGLVATPLTLLVVDGGTYT